MSPNRNQKTQLMVRIELPASKGKTGIFDYYPNKRYLPEPSYLGDGVACRQESIPFLTSRIAGIAPVERGAISRSGSYFFFSMGRWGLYNALLQGAPPPSFIEAVRYAS
jgi:hypothetical protein